MISLNKQFSLKKLESGMSIIVCTSHENASCWHMKRLPKYVKKKAEFISNNTLVKDDLLTFSALSLMLMKLYDKKRIAQITNLTAPGWMYDDKNK